MHDRAPDLHISLKSGPRRADFLLEAVNREGRTMSYQQGPNEYDLRQRAAMRVARRRAFFTSLAITGSLAVLDLYLYSQSHDQVWLLLAVVFIGIVAYRAWVAF